MSERFVTLILKRSNLTFIKKNRHKSRKRKITFIATKFIARSTNVIQIPFKVIAPRPIKFTMKIKTKMNYMPM